MSTKPYVIIIEDEIALINEIMNYFGFDKSEMFKRQKDLGGYFIKIFTSKEEAYSTLQNNTFAPNGIDIKIIFLDLRLTNSDSIKQILEPSELSGSRILSLLCESGYYNDTFVYVMTAYTFTEESFNEYIRKFKCIKDKIGLMQKNSKTYEAIVENKFSISTIEENIETHLGKQSSKVGQQSFDI
jgi:hypothetical protein